jgi:hypothetical protein
MSFDFGHETGICRMHDRTKPEAAVALDEAFVRNSCEQNRLDIRSIRRGGWFAGTSNDQDVILAEKANPTACS